VADIVKINLSSGKITRRKRPELFRQFIGGGGLAAALLNEELDAAAGPLSPENVIVFAAGPLSPYFPCISKTATVFRSPLTGEYGESHAGGRMACSMRIAGLDAVIISGKAAAPSYITISDSDIKVRDAQTLWGMTSTRTTTRILRERHRQPFPSVTVIGRAGENGVTYASATVDSFRHFGRLGLGAVMGSKNLKAILVSGTGELPVPDKKLYSDVYSKVFEKVVATDAMTKYHDLGTSINTMKLNLLGGLPTRNFQSGKFELAEEISGEQFGDKLLARQTACMHCPIGCIHVASLREQFGLEHEFTTREVTYDYELIYALGSNLGIGSAEEVLSLINACESAGLDAISAGVSLSWATEALDKGVISLNETDVALAFGDTAGYIESIGKIASRDGKFWRNIGEGAEKASMIYGGSEFAIAFGKNESPGYHTGAGAITGAMLGFRHSHLDNAGYSIDQKNIKGYSSPEFLADEIISEETQRQVITSLHACLFARNVFTLETVADCFHATGRDFTTTDLEDAGHRIFKMKNSLRSKLGYDIDKLRIPARVLQTITPMGHVEENFVRKVIEAYRLKTGL